MKWPALQILISFILIPFIHSQKSNKQQQTAPIQKDDETTPVAILLLIPFKHPATATFSELS